MSIEADQQRTAASLGVWAMPGAGAFSGLKDRLAVLYADRFAKIPWLPAGWLDSVKALQRADQSALVLLTPGIGMLRPSFCVTQEQADAWQVAYKAVEAAQVAYGKGEAVKGAALIAAADLNLAIWSGLYTAAVFVRDIPTNAVGAVLDGTQSVVGSIIKRLMGSWLFWVAAAGGLGFIAWRVGLFTISRPRKG